MSVDIPLNQIERLNNKNIWLALDQTLVVEGADDEIAIANGSLARPDRMVVAFPNHLPITLGYADNRDVTPEDKLWVTNREQRDGIVIKPLMLSRARPEFFLGTEYRVRRVHHGEDRNGRKELVVSSLNPARFAKFIGVDDLRGFLLRIKSQRR
jgi:hypothetical protein